MKIFLTKQEGNIADNYSYLFYNLSHGHTNPSPISYFIFPLLSTNIPNSHGTFTPELTQIFILEISEPFVVLPGLGYYNLTFIQDMVKLRQAPRGKNLLYFIKTLPYLLCIE